jgi:hypothetical protein
MMHGATSFKYCKAKQIYTGKIPSYCNLGIFLSKGFDELNKYFDGIYCTNKLP